MAFDAIDAAVSRDIDTVVTVPQLAVGAYVARPAYVEDQLKGGSTSLYADYQRLIDRKTVQKLLSKKPPLGPEPAIRQGAKGYVAGYNRYLKETGVDRLPDSRCRGKPWVRPITLSDFFARVVKPYLAHKRVKTFVDRWLLEPRLPPQLFYNLMLAARKPLP